MSITMTAEQLTQQYLNGKSIKRLSIETGKGEWAIRKQIQRYRNSQKTLLKIQPISQENLVPVNPKQKPLDKFAVAIGLIGFMLILYFIYMDIKNKRKSRTPVDNGEFKS